MNVAGYITLTRSRGAPIPRRDVARGFDVDHRPVRPIRPAGPFESRTESLEKSADASTRLATLNRVATNTKRAGKMRDHVQKTGFASGERKNVQRLTFQRRSRSDRSPKGTFARVGSFALALVWLANGDVRASTERGELGLAFPRDPSRRALLLGTMTGEPRGAADPALVAALIEAVQAHASDAVWGWSTHDRSRWVAREDGAGFWLDEGGLVIVPASTGDEAGASAARLRTVWVGRRDEGQAVRGRELDVQGVRGHLRLSEGIAEEWIHGPLGLEQRWTLDRPPPGSGPIRIGVFVDGDLRPRVGSARGDIELVDARTQVRGRYGETYARDAEGRELDVRLSVDGRMVWLHVDDAGAMYPVVIDPLVWVEQATLAASEASRNAQFGTSVALSADGNRALVGAPLDDVGSVVDQGAAYLFVRVGQTWTAEARIVASDGSTGAEFGQAVALSYDGTRALVGARSQPVEGRARQGAAYVFLRSGASWSEEARLVAPNGAAEDFFGSSVDLDGSGSQALIGAPRKDVGANSGQGAAYVFVRSGSAWSHEQELLASDGRPGAGFGSAVSLCNDPNLALVGAPGGTEDAGGPAGAAYVFIRSTPSWSWVEFQRLRGSDHAERDLFGFSVALAGEGTRALVGAPRSNEGGNPAQGSAYVFLRSDALWTQEAKLVASDGVADARLGWSVELSADGGRALAGAPYAGTAGPTSSAAAYVFVRAGMSWNQEAKLVARESPAGARLGASVALPAFEPIALVGMPFDLRSGGSMGLARVFGLGCSTSSDCESGLVCVDGRCETSVSTDAGLSEPDAFMAATGADAEVTSPSSTHGGCTCRATKPPSHAATVSCVCALSGVLLARMRRRRGKRLVAKEQATPLRHGSRPTPPGGERRRAQLPPT